MNEWYDSQKKKSGNFRKMVEERLEKTNPCRTELTAKYFQKALYTLLCNKNKNGHY